jgi:hypothetical protein
MMVNLFDLERECIALALKTKCDAAPTSRRPETWCTDCMEKVVQAIVPYIAARLGA